MSPAPEVIATARGLAHGLAEQTRHLRARIEALGRQPPGSPLGRLHAACRAAGREGSPADFADACAQALVCCLLAAQLSERRGKSGPSGAPQTAATLRVPDPAARGRAAGLVPAVRGRQDRRDPSGARPGGSPTRWLASPLLSDLFALLAEEEGGPARGLGIGPAAEVLRRADLPAVLHDLAARHPEHEPALRFYELFLDAYDPCCRRRHGVFATPRPIVSFLVRSVDEVLRRDLGLADGLADTAAWGQVCARLPGLTPPAGVGPDEPFVQMLDPATGTGTFLVEVIDQIHRTLTERWRRQGEPPEARARLWNHYVPRHLLPRLHGHELLLAPWAIAHLQVAGKLAETGYDFAVKGQVGIALGNALQPGAGGPITVVLGNPPYSAARTSNSWLAGLMAPYKEGLAEAKSDLEREEWKFLRYAEWRVADAGAGVLGLVVNRSCLDGLTHRHLRRHLGQTFPARTVVDLHGDVKGQAVRSPHSPDQNVFPIEQGVCIALLATHGPRGQRHVSLVGPRNEKLAQLQAHTADTLPATALGPAPPAYLWVPAEDDPPEYAAAWKVTALFPTYSSGIQTKKDAIAVARDRQQLADTLHRFLSCSVAQLRRHFGITRDTGPWTVARAKSDLEALGFDPERITPLLYRPFDRRFTYLTERSGGFLGRPRAAVVKHMLGGDNLGLIVNRQITGAGVSHFLVSRTPICHGTFYLGNRGQDYLLPLYLRTEEGTVANCSAALVAALATRLGLSWRPHGMGTLAPGGSVGPEDVLHYVYALFHAPAYRTRYGSALRRDFPRVFLPAGLGPFRALCGAGAKLVALHLLEETYPAAWEGGAGCPLRGPLPTFHAGAGAEVGRDCPRYDAGRRRVHVNAGSWFDGVPAEAWDCQVGGYRVCAKWLKDRRGRALVAEEVEHYRKVVAALAATVRLMAEIDEVIAAHGGWSAAFSEGSDLGL
jgi:hypothetical protein